MFLDRRHTAIAPAVDRLDHPLRATTVPNGSTRQHHKPFQDVIADKLLGPQGVEEFLARHHSVTVLDEINEQLEDFG
jgi:hypothetical protein